MSDMMDMLFATPSTRPRVERPKAQTGGRKPPPPIPLLPYKPGDESDDNGTRRLLPHEKAMLAHDGYLVNDPRKPKQQSRPDFADDIDKLVASYVAEGWLYLDVKADEYRARDRRWREMSEEEKSWQS